MSEELGCILFAEVSAVTGEGVEQLFKDIANYMSDKIQVQRSAVETDTAQRRPHQGLKLLKAELNKCCR